MITSYDISLRAASLSLGLASLSMLAPSSALAQEEIQAAPGEAAAVEEDSLVINGGLILIWAQSPVIGTDDKVLPIPFVSVEWGHFYFKGVEAGWSFDEIGGFDISAGLRADFTFWDADDSDYLDGMKDRNATAQAGVSVSHKLPGGFEAGLGFWHDVLDVHGGWDVELALSYPIFISRKLMLEPSLGIDLVSEKKARYYYGVFDDEARADRPAYDPGAGWLAGADLTLRYLRSETSSIFLSLGASYLSGELSDSPIVDDDIVLNAGLGIAWKF